MATRNKKPKAGPKGCPVQGCGRNTHGKSMCKSHIRRKKAGNPGLPIRPYGAK